MTWIESHSNLARHPKTRRLMKLLGWSLPDTIGNLHLLWWWALDFAPTGDLSRFSAEDLTADLDLCGATPEQFIGAMVAAGFLDRIEETLCIHDWVDYTSRSRRSPRPALPVLSPRPGTPGHDSNPVVPPRREASTTPSHLRPTQTVQDPTLPNVALPGPQGAVHVDRVEDAARNGVPAPEQIFPTCAVRESKLVGSALRADPYIASLDSESPASELSEPDSATNNSDSAPSHARLISRSDSGGADSSYQPEQQPGQVATPHIPHVLDEQPGFTDIWWPKLLEESRERGCSLDSIKQGKILERLAKEPLAAIPTLKKSLENFRGWGGPAGPVPLGREREEYLENTS